MKWGGDNYTNQCSSIPEFHLTAQCGADLVDLKVSSGHCIAIKCTVHGANHINTSQAFFPDTNVRSTVTYPFEACGAQNRALFIAMEIKCRNAPVNQ